MSMDFKVRTWLWVALATVIVLGGGFTWWYTYGNKGAITTKTSPTPTKSVALSPSAGITTSPTSGKTSTPAVTPTVETKTWEGKIPYDGASDLGCNITVSFKYPSSYSVRRTGGTPMVGSATWLEIYKSGNDYIYVDPLSADIHTDYSPVSCITPAYENLNDFVARNNISNYNFLTLNGLPAIQYTFNEKRITAIQNTDKNIAGVRITSTSTDLDAYNIIINSLSFK